MALAACSRPAPPATTAAEAAPAGPGYLKGQLHTHTDKSDDGHTSPADVVAFYRKHDYDFLALTDHNVVTRFEGRAGKLLVIPGMELTQNLQSCLPPPEPGLACLLHVNALFLGPAAAGSRFLPSADNGSRADLYRNSIGSTKELGGIAMINHPNQHYGASGPLLAQLSFAGAALVEIANESSDSNDAGDATHPPTTALWDFALGAGATLWGVASDDAHDFSDAAAARQGRPEGDRGFVMVRAERNLKAIREALLLGDFYASTGVILDSITTKDDTLAVKVHPEPGRTYRITFIGLEARVVSFVDGLEAHQEVGLGRAAYVRAEIKDDLGRRAFTQPLRRAVPGNE